MEIPVSELKYKIKQALDAVDEGTIVTITRRGKKYHISPAADQDTISFLKGVIEDQGRRLRALEGKTNEPQHWEAIS